EDQRGADERRRAAKPFRFHRLLPCAVRDGFALTRKHRCWSNADKDSRSDRPQFFRQMAAIRGGEPGGELAASLREVAPAQRQTPGQSRLANIVRKRRRIDRRETRAWPGTPGKADHSVLGGDHVAGPERRIVAHIERCKAHSVPAVAGAFVDELLAVHKSGIEVRIALTVLRHRAADLRAKKHFGLAVRANRPAGFAWRVFGHVLHRKMVAVAQPHARGDAMTGGAATFTNAFVSECCRRNSSRHRRGRRMFLRAPRRLPTPRAAKQKIKKSLFGAGRLRSDQQKYGHQHSDDDCRRPECELPVCRASARDLTALTHGNPLRPFSSTVRYAPPILRRIARATTRRSNRVILYHVASRPHPGSAGPH